MSRILVTGGSGFLGSAVAEKLVARGEEVFIGDVRDPLAKISGAEYLRFDVLKAAQVRDLFEEKRFDAVVHLAAIMTPGADVEFEYRVDVEGARNVFEAAANTGVKRVVVSSSGAAYGYHADSPKLISETDPIRGNEEYSYSRHKRLVEEMLSVLRESNPDMEQTIFRIGTILGPTVSNQITALWDGKRILQIRGSDSPFVFIWVDDVAEVMARAATGAPAGIYNVAGDGAMTVAEIAARLRKPLLVVPAALLKAALWIGRAFKLTEHGPEKVRFLRYRPVLDNAKLKTEFGYIPSKTTREAFESYIETHPDVVAHN